MSTTNLWSETLDILNREGKTWDDVIFITNIIGGIYSDNGVEFEIEKSDFKEIARSLNYDNGFGGVEVSIHLKIVGQNWWLERREYDGSERWVYKSQPKKPTATITEAKVYLLDMDEEGSIETLFIRSR